MSFIIATFIITPIRHQADMAMKTTSRE